MDLLGIGRILGAFGIRFDKPLIDGELSLLDIADINDIFGKDCGDLLRLVKRLSSALT